MSRAFAIALAAATVTATAVPAAAHDVPVSAVATPTRWLALGSQPPTG